MALVTANGQTVFDAQIFTPRFGAWHCDLRLDDPSQVTGAVTVVAGSRTLVGTAIRSAEFIEVGMVRILAGAGALGVSARPQHYTGASLGMILGDLLSGVGEKMSATADQMILGIEVASWTTTARPVGNVIRDLFAAAAPGAAWRFLDDGTMWAGTDTFPPAGIPTTAYQVQDKRGEENAIDVATDGPIALVATTFEGGKVNCVQEDVPHIGITTARIWFEDAAAFGADRFVAGVQKIVRGTAPGVDHRFMYAGAVVAQSGSQVDVAPEISGVPEMDQVPLFAQAGDSVDGVEGGRALVGWAGDPSRRFGMGFDAGATPATRVLKVLTMLFLGDAAALPALAGTPYRAAEVTLNTALAAAFSALAAASTGPLSALQAQFTAIAAAITAFESTATGANGFLATKVSVL